VFSSILSAVPIMALLTIFQTVILPRFSPLEADPSLPFLVALAWGLLSNSEEGVIWAFIGGLFMDIFTIAPAGGLSLSYMAGVFAASMMSDLLPPNRLLIPVISAVVATIIQQLVYLLYLRIFGIPVNANPLIFVQVIVVQSILIMPIYWLISLIKRLMRPRPVQV
jgi:rod shape-determining protein MreD